MTHQQRRFDVAVVGGGAIGLAIAWQAARRGLRVVVLERGGCVGGGASWVAAGMLAPVTEARLTELPLLELGVASAAIYPTFVAELQEQTGIDPGYERYGTLVVARDADEAQALERELEVHHRLGLDVARLRPSEARRLESALAPGIRLALEVPDDHAVDPRRLTEALARAARSAGAEVKVGAEVVGVLAQDGALRGLELRHGRIEAERVVVAAGVWSDALEGIPPEARIPVHPVKGQVVRLRDPAGAGLIRRVLRTGGSYLVPRGDGRYVLGATMEERGFDTTVTAGAVFELLRDAGEIAPGISELVVEEVIAGLRPSTPDGLPVLGAGAMAGLHWAVGHFRNGILLAPITAEMVVAGLLGEDPPDLAGAFSPARFSTVPVGV